MDREWPERVREVIEESLQLAERGEPERALIALDGFLEEAPYENRGEWRRVLCRHAAVFAHIMGDVRREIRYTEEALPYVEHKEYRFAIYNFARLLLRDGQIGLAKRYATEAYKLSLAEGTENDRDLVAAILEYWPDIGETR